MEKGENKASPTPQSSELLRCLEGRESKVVKIGEWLLLNDPLSALRGRDISRRARVKCHIRTRGGCPGRVILHFLYHQHEPAPYPTLMQCNRDFLLTSVGFEWLATWLFSPLVGPKLEVG